MTLIRGRNSGASYRNRVELQNGCLALAHANLFIPSTLNGSCLSSGGKINEKLLRDNLNDANDVYISGVDKEPCAGTAINLFKGVDSSSFQRENEFVKTYLKGSKAAKEELKISHPREFAKIEEIWQLRKTPSLRCTPQVYILSQLLL